MDLTMGLAQEQTQKLLMTTQMKQSLELLQCTSEELDAMLAEEVLNNPLTELRPLSVEQAVAWSQRLPAADGSVLRTGSTRDAYSGFPLEQTVSAKLSWIDQIMFQIREWYAAPKIEHAALQLVGYLDECGYLREDDHLLAQLIGCEVSVVQEARAVLQRCEPTGIGARDLRECLLLQIDSVPESLRPVVERLICDYLTDVADGRVPLIAKRLRMSPAAVQAAVDALRRLNPKPACTVAEAETYYIRPEVTVQHVLGRYVVTTNDGTVSEVVLNPNYARLLQQTRDREAQKYLWKKYHAAQWLIRSVEQRRHTIRRVAEAIVSVQQGFFAEGMSGLRPLTLRQVAELLDLHESTVSRAVRGKFMQTPRGVFEFKYFFTAELGADTGTVSARTVKQRIRTLVAAEDPGSPHSDTVICSMLQAEGIHVSRRTVAKYREEMDIPASSRRRRFA